MVTHIQLVSRLNINVDTSPVAHMPESCAQGQMFLHTVITEDVGWIQLRKGFDRKMFLRC